MATERAASRHIDVWHVFLTGLFLATCVLSTATRLSGIRATANPGWLETLPAVTAFFATLVGLARRLPPQNVVTVALLVAGIAWSLLTLNLETGAPFGRVSYLPAAGPTLPGGAPMVLLLIWVVMVVNACEIARAVAGLRKQSSFRGWWQLGIATALVLGFEMLHQRFATEVMGFWQWMDAGSPPRRVTPPWSNTLSWLVMMPMLLLLLLPWLIDKRPVSTRAGSVFGALCIWLGFAGWMMAGLWKTDGRSAVLFLFWNVAVGGLAMAGAKRDRAGT